MSQAEEIEKLKSKQIETSKDVEYLRKSVDETLSAIRECTSTMQSLAQQFATYTAKHDETQKDIEELKQNYKEVSITQNLQGTELAVMRPFFEALKAGIWKLAGAALLISGGATAIGTAVTKVIT